ncbi:O-antigen ligase family protein [Flavitalea sp. BT771]|uniref:O-antigen ligase family protein n=1 Tax=Flavitalea sp. BT771 TaxID=3063329 RepID=UPI0026E46333|nr:O-antigen ligase family protein [Flavitalea sp. BT771]MDO6432584.1 O-antigen ligase family protein [Flavitalea sp. BT771]MDV6222140.1 O-antigen ligase family protein [Flavitalea sp. BT771]
MQQSASKRRGMAGVDPLLSRDTVGRSLSRKEQLLYWLSAGFFCTLFLPGMPVVNNVFTGGLFVFSFFYNTLAEKRQLLVLRKEVLLMVLFFLLHIISVFFSQDKREAVNMLVLRIPLLLFPLSLGLIHIRPALKNRILLSYCCVVTVVALICLVWALAKYLRTGDGVYLYNDSLTLPIKMQSSYFALVVSVAVFSIFYLLESGYLVRLPKRYAQLSIVFLLVFHFLLASRISLFILYAGLLILAGSYMVKMKRTGLGLLLVAGLLICVVVCIRAFPKTLNRFRELEYPTYHFNSEAAESHYNGTLTPDQWNGANIRLAIWKCGWQVGKAHWLTGVQLGDKQARLMEAYKANGFEFGVRNRRNMHSLYLDIFCCFGIIGLALFLAGYLVLPLRTAWRSADWIGLAILLTFAIGMIVESYFDRSAGCLLAGFFFSFIAGYKDGIPGKKQWNMWVVG